MIHIHNKVVIMNHKDGILCIYGGIGKLFTIKECHKEINSTLPKKQIQHIQKNVQLYKSGGLKIAAA